MRPPIRYDFSSTFIADPVSFYEVVEYPDELATRYDRTIYEVCRIPDGGQTGKFHYPLTIEGYGRCLQGLPSLGCKQRIRDAVNDRIGIEPQA